MALTREERDQIVAEELDRKAKSKVYQARYWREQRGRIVARLRDKKRELRGLAMIALGGICTSCGESRPEVLTIDHIVALGLARRERGYAKEAGAELYKKILKDSTLARAQYQLLCANCHLIKSKAEIRRRAGMKAAPSRGEGAVC